MKKLLLFFFVLSFTLSFGQNVLKFKATSYSVIRIINGQQQPQSKWQDANLLIVIDNKKETIVTYNSKGRVQAKYNHIGYFTQNSLSGNSEILGIKCVNSKGVVLKCKIVFSESIIKTIIFSYPDYSVLYEGKELED